jgi:hypothetical protein
MAKVKKKWRAVMIPGGLVDEIEKYIETPEAVRRGFTSIASVVEHSVRKELGLG